MEVWSRRWVALVGLTTILLVSCDPDPRQCVSRSVGTGAGIRFESVDDIHVFRVEAPEWAEEDLFTIPPVASVEICDQPNSAPGGATHSEDVSGWSLECETYEFQTSCTLPDSSLRELFLCFQPLTPGDVQVQMTSRIPNPDCKKEVKVPGPWNLVFEEVSPQPKIIE